MILGKKTLEIGIYQTNMVMTHLLRLHRVIQLYIEKGRLLAEFDSMIELVDAGDIIGVTGTMKRTEKVSLP